MDPYIEAQKRLDRGETKCTIDTSLSSCIAMQCRQYMSIDVRELKEQILMMGQVKRLTEKLVALAEEKAALVAKMANVEWRGDEQASPAKRPSRTQG